MSRRPEFVSSRSLPEKLGIRAGTRVLLVGVPDQDFHALLRSVEAEVHETETATGFDAIFFRVESPEQLARLSELRRLLKSEGAIWVLRVKGRERTVSEGQAMAAGKEFGLVDVKVVNFSERESALKFVIPLALRK